MTHLPPGLWSLHRRSGRRSPIRDRPATVRRQAGGPSRRDGADPSGIA